MKNLAFSVLITAFTASICYGQDHFVPVWTGNGHDHMNFYITGATINGNPLETDDEIAVYDGVYCVGMIRLTGQITDFAEIRASRDDADAGINGYTQGNTISFRFWDSSEGTEIDSINTSYASGPDTFTISASATLSLSVLTNQAPVADAGTAQTVNEGDTVTLDGSASSDPDLDPVDYAWDIPAILRLTDTSMVNPRFIAPEVSADSSISLTLQVTDSNGSTDSDTVLVTIRDVNKVPLITGQNPVSTPEETTIRIRIADLIIVDADSDTSDMMLSVLAGDNYTRTNDLLTPATDFTGDLSVPVVVFDGTDVSQEFMLTVSVTNVNDRPVVTGQAASVSTIENQDFRLDPGQLSVADPDSDSTDFLLVVHDSTGYSFSGTTVTPDNGFTGTLYIPVSISDGDLTSSRFVLSVTVIPQLKVEHTKADVTTVGGHDGEISVTAMGGTPPYSYNWNTGAFLPTIRYLYPGIYIVTIEDSGSQAVTDTIEISEPEVQQCDITADFTYTIDSITQEVSFTLSSNEYDYFWTFGDGNVSDLEAPTYFYSNPGLYEVCLTAYDDASDCSYEVCKMIEVGSPECIAAFNFYLDEDNNSLMHFTDNSKGAVSGWYWNFSDGTISTEQNPDHEFIEAGTYQVCLYTLDTLTNCLSEVCREITIGTRELIADFTYFINPVTRRVSFTNNSSGDIAEWYWTFGDGNVHKGQQTSHVYEDPGVYQVCLSVINTAGEFTEICKELKVGRLPCNIQSAFSYFIIPDENKISLNSVSSGTVHSYSWNFGDGTGSSAANPEHTYDKPGYYLIGLSVRDTLAKCNDFHAELIQVGAARCKSFFKFSVDPEELTVSLKDNSLGNIEKYFWTFDDGTTSTEASPVHTYTEPGIYDIGLTVTDATGTCIDYYSAEVQVGFVDCSADFTVFIDSSENTAYFTSQSPGRLLDHYWVFSDGVISTERDPEHTFQVPGYHKISLNTYNPLSGCMDYGEQTILIGSQNIDCEADFIYTADEKTHRVSFADQSLGEDLSFFWNFGDKAGGFSESQNPDYQYKKGGIYNVCLTVYSSTGIQNTTCKSVFAGAPELNNCLARFIHSVDNETRTVTFKDKSFGKPDLWKWGLGDGDSSDLQNPVHQYQAPGYYTVHQIIRKQNRGCHANAFALVNVAKEGKLVAGFGYLIDSTINTKAESYPVDYVGVTLGDANKFKWSFGDGTYDSTTTTPTHIYTAPGKYEVCLTVYDDVAGTQSTTCDTVVVGSTTSVAYLDADATGQLVFYPNPADSRALIAFDLPREGKTEISLYSLEGRKIETILNRHLLQGRQEITWQTGHLKNGMYLLRMQSGSRSGTRLISIQH